MLIDKDIEYNVLTIPFSCRTKVVNESDYYQAINNPFTIL